MRSAHAVRGFDGARGAGCHSKPMVRSAGVAKAPVLQGFDGAGGGICADPEQDDGIAVGRVVGMGAEGRGDRRLAGGRAAELAGLGGSGRLALGERLRLA